MGRNGAGRASLTRDRDPGASAAWQVPVEDTVRSQIELLSRSTRQELNGRFVNRTGDDLPW